MNKDKISCPACGARSIAAPRPNGDIYCTCSKCGKIHNLFDSPEIKRPESKGPSVERPDFVEIREGVWIRRQNVIEVELKAGKKINWRIGLDDGTAEASIVFPTKEAAMHWMQKHVGLDVRHYRPLEGESK